MILKSNINYFSAAVRSGDYYMFDDMDDDEVSELIADEEEEEYEEEDELEKLKRRDTKGRRMTISEVINTFINRSKIPVFQLYPHGEKLNENFFFLIEPPGEMFLGFISLVRIVFSELGWPANEQRDRYK